MKYAVKNDCDPDCPWMWWLQNGTKVAGFSAERDEMCVTNSLRQATDDAAQFRCRVVRILTHAEAKRKAVATELRACAALMVAARKDLLDRYPSAECDAHEDALRDVRVKLQNKAELLWPVKP